MHLNMNSTLVYLLQVPFQHVDFFHGKFYEKKMLSIMHFNGFVFTLLVKALGSPCKKGDNREFGCISSFYGLGTGGRCFNDKCICREDWAPSPNKLFCFRISKFSHFIPKESVVIPSFFVCHCI